MTLNICLLPDDIQRIIFLKIVKRFTEERRCSIQLKKMKNLLITSALSIRVYRNYKTEFSVSDCVKFVHQWGPMIRCRAQLLYNE
ncbi:hypothetical protein EXVG_00368 [Emiliania huxleyi virus 202]|nr:hypothetical protein EXVG_00368 [Emiliania huxleyi virus 202]AHA54264.1 hypothetical protein EhV18_00217 [Emiliania huxleyi virus 18]AHA55311.1 hypothetical protein EhV156_00215 [Emiliania huxleyi virus 156]